MTLEVVVLGELGGNPADLSDELLKAKSALLYGDQVLIKSHKVPFLVGGFASMTRSITKQALERGVDQEMVERAIAALEEDSEITESPLGKLFLGLPRGDDPWPVFEFPEVVSEVLRKSGPLDGQTYFRQLAPEGVKSYLEDKGVTGQDHLVEAVEELVRLDESELVAVDTAGAEEVLRAELDDLDAAFKTSLQKAAETFAVNRLDHPLLTTGTQLDLRRNIRGKERPIALSKASRAELAACMIADIPSFPTASVDEVLDIRERVSAQLGRFRAAVADLEEELNADIGNEDFPEAVEDLKLRRVTPELDELRESLRDEGLGQTASRSAPYLATGVLGLGASVAIGAPELASAVAISAGATTALAKEIVERAKLDRERKSHRHFSSISSGA